MSLPNPDLNFTGLDGNRQERNFVKGFDDHLDNYGNPGAWPDRSQEIKHIDQDEEIEHITATVPLQEYRNPDTGDVLLFDPADQSYVVRVTTDGRVSTAYTCQVPPASLTSEEVDTTSLEGFEPGFTT